ncbi:MAG: c-type cytochrome, partial [Planctomycetales bacterium]|nr:c-type cytochrome [Planctomycetales bacterium]
DLKVSSPKSVVSSVVDDARKRIASSTENRVDAISQLCLGRFDEISADLEALISPTQPIAVRNAAVTELASFRSPVAGQMLIAAIPGLPAGTRRVAIDRLVSRNASANAVLESIRSGLLNVTYLSSQQKQRFLSHPDQRVSKAAKELLGAESDRTAVLGEMKSVLAMSGDVGRGQIAFRKVCVSCHQLEGHGTPVGPDLAPLRNRGAEFLLTNIIDPSREVDARYEAFNVVTKDGRTFQGIVIKDDESTVSLLQSDGKRIDIAKDDVDLLQATGKSLMPDGLEKELTAQGVADIIAYLISLE